MYFSPYYRDFVSNLGPEDGKDRSSVSAGSFDGQHKYELAEPEVEQIFDKPAYQQVIHSVAFQRLKKIHFLGSIDYLIDPSGPKPNKRHTRYQHSLGVARLTLQFAREKQLAERDEVLCVVSGLLHDIGHAPLSHSLESVFKDEYGIGHHLVSERIVRGDIPIGRDLHKILLTWKINPFEILLIMNGKGPDPFREIFNYAINVDTIEAILRSSTYVYGNRLSWPPSVVLGALLKRDSESTEILDRFWRLKDEIYSKLINHRMGVLADYICRGYMRSRMSSFQEDYYYLTETELKERHPQLFANLQSLSSTKPHQLLPYTAEIKFVSRRFNINSEVPLESIRSVNLRYTQTRSEETYRLTAD